MKLWLARHGESEGNVAATLQGCRLDTALSAVGRRQAEALAVRLAEAPIDRVVASPMIRARETAEVVAAPHGLGVSTDRDLVEFDWGSWTGRPLDDEMERHIAELRARWRSGEIDVAPPGGESPARALERATRAMSRLRAAGSEGTAVVAHGRFNRVLITALLGRHLSEMDDVRQRNGSLSMFDWSGTGAARPLLLDDVGHLDPELQVLRGGSDSVR